MSEPENSIVAERSRRNAETLEAAKKRHAERTAAAAARATEKEKR
jgi:hypothetical protein